MNDIAEEIIAELTIELQKDPAFNADILAIKVKNAIREVILKRNYSENSYTETQIKEDLYNYYSVIKSVALYDYNQIGIEGETSHSENGTSRGYVDRNSLFVDVRAIAKII